MTGYGLETDCRKRHAIQVFWALTQWHGQREPPRSGHRTYYFDTKAERDSFLRGVAESRGLYGYWLKGRRV